MKKFLAIYICIFCLQLFAQEQKSKTQSISDKYILMLSSSELETDRKIEILNDLKKKDISSEEVKNLCSFISICDENILEYLVKFIVGTKYGKNPEVLRNAYRFTKDRIIQKKINSIPMVLSLLDIMRSDIFKVLYKDDIKKEQAEKELFLECWAKHDSYEDFKLFLDDPVLPLYTMLSTEFIQGKLSNKYLDFLLKRITAGDNLECQKYVLNFLIENDLLPDLNEEHVQYLIPLTSSTSSEVSKFATAILSAITHCKPQGGWHKWSEENRHFSIEKQALLIFNDETAEENEKSTALAQLILRRTKNIEDHYPSFILNKKTPLSLRKEILGYYMDHVYISKDKTKYNEAEQLLTQVLADTELRLYAVGWIPVKTSFFLDGEKNRKFLLQLAEKEADRLTESNIIYALSQSKYDKKRIASLTLASFERDLKIKAAEDKAFFMKLLALSNLRKIKDIKNKEAKTLDFWHKAISAMPDDPPEGKEDE